MALLTFNIPARSMTVMNFSCLAIAFTPDYCSLRIFADRPLCFSRCQRSRRSDRYPCLNQPIPVVHIGSPQKIFGTKMVTDAHAGRVLSTCSTRGPSCWPSYFASSGPGAVSPPRDPEFCKSPSAGADETPKILEISSSTTRSCPDPAVSAPGRSKGTSSSAGKNAGADCGIISMPPGGELCGSSALEAESPKTLFISSFAALF